MDATHQLVVTCTLDYESEFPGKGNRPQTMHDAARIMLSCGDRPLRDDEIQAIQRSVWAVVEFEPAITELGPPESELTAWDQMNEVWGPFDSEREADEWIDRRKAQLARDPRQTPRHFCIQQTTVPVPMFLKEPA